MIYRFKSYGSLAGPGKQAGRASRPQLQSGQRQEDQDHQDQDYVEDQDHQDQDQVEDQDHQDQAQVEDQDHQDQDHVEDQEHLECCRALPSCGLGLVLQQSSQE